MAGQLRAGFSLLNTVAFLPKGMPAGPLLPTSTPPVMEIYCQPLCAAVALAGPRTDLLFEATVLSAVMAQQREATCPTVFS